MGGGVWLESSGRNGIGSGFGRGRGSNDGISACVEVDRELGSWNRAWKVEQPKRRGSVAFKGVGDLRSRSYPGIPERRRVYSDSAGSSGICGIWQRIRRDTRFPRFLAGFWAEYRGIRQRVDNMDDARKMFDAMSTRDAVSWNSLTNGYVEQEKIEEAYALCDSMPEKDVISWTSMVMGFSKRGWTEESISLFELMPQKADVSWTAIISGLVHNGKLEIACQWFSKMVKEGIKLNPLVTRSMLSALASLTILKEGMQMNACVVKMGLDSDIFILSSLISMYSKCGNLSEACQIFSSIRTSNIVTINSMITVFAQLDLAQEAFDLFRKMQGDGQMPNEISFLAILTACSRSGLVEEGNHYFNSMRSVHGIEPGPDHYTCMVDLFGRASFLQEVDTAVSEVSMESKVANFGNIENKIFDPGICLLQQPLF